MEHIAYCDKKAKELERLMSREKTMLIRGAAGRKLPHGRVNTEEKVFLIDNDGSGLIKAVGEVAFTLHSEKLTQEEATELINKYDAQLKLTPAQKERWEGKRYLCLIELKNVKGIEPFSYVREKNMDDWIIVESVKEISK